MIQCFVLSSTTIILIMKSGATNLGPSEEGQKDPSILANDQVKRWERKVLAVPIPHRQLLVTFPKLPCLWPILDLDFSPLFKIILFLFGTEVWHARSDTVWCISDEQTTESQHQASSIVGSLTLNSWRTGRVRTKPGLMIQARHVLQLPNGFILKFLLRGSLPLAVKATLFDFK